MTDLEFIQRIEIAIAPQMFNLVDSPRDMGMKAADFAIEFLHGCKDEARERLEEENKRRAAVPSAKYCPLPKVESIEELL